jgi:hypothetical protein
VVDDVLSAERASAQYDRRRAFIASYSYAVPTRDAVRRIRGFVGDRRLLEVAAGSGLWARLLADEGAAAVATDGGVGLQPAWFRVEVAAAESAVRGHPDCGALLLCWPPFGDACAYRALTAFAGDRLVYIGDPRFTADDEFHMMLERSWRCIETIPLPSWPGIADAAYLYVRRTSLANSEGN